MLQDKFIQFQLEELESFERYDREVLKRELIKNQNKIQELYYNKKEDEQWIEHYYSKIDINGSVSEQFVHYLHQLISETHKHKYPYYISKDRFLYTWVDLHTNGQLKSIYSGALKHPLTVMNEDYETVQKRFKRYRELDIDERQSKLLETHVMNISRQHKYNTEHVVPQSWYKAKEPMKGDLHHLFVCEPKCNSARANYPYFDYMYYNAIKSENISNYCGTYEEGRFEPMYGKGAVARATLYFLLRYPATILKKYRKMIDLSLLQYWNEQFPVSEYEKHRNKSIYEIQGNRNPFIDYPNLVKKIINVLKDM